MKKPFEKITDSELEIMQVLWEAGDALPVTEIRQRLCEKTEWESSTIKTLVQRLFKKGAIKQEKRGVYYYTPMISREEYNLYATKNLIEKLYHGSAKNLVAALVGSGLSEKDVSELREMFSIGGKDE
jgi:BlaI family penicillinase repressor